MDRLVAACQRYGVAAGFLTANPDDAQHWIAKGSRAISLGADVSMYGQAFRKFHDGVVAGLASDPSSCKRSYYGTDGSAKL